MADKRLIFYNDARHYHLYCYEPPISLEDARAPVDEVASTHVDTFVYGPGAGPSMYYLTKVGEVMGSHLSSFKDIPGVQRGTLPVWRAYENIISLKERGIDLMHLLVERAHERGMKFIASYRQTHSVASNDVDNYFNWQFKIDHPEWCLTGKGAHGFNFIHPEVRAERFALAEEAANDYDVDGIEIDWCFWPYLFEEDQIANNRGTLTDYMRQHRHMVDAAAARKGRTLEFGARVLPTLKGNLDAGFDVPAWIEENLLDFVVPNYYVDEQIDADFPFDMAGRLGRRQPLPGVAGDATAYRSTKGKRRRADRRGDGPVPPLPRSGCNLLRQGRRRDLSTLVQLANRGDRPTAPQRDRRPGSSYRKGETLRRARS